MKLLLLSVPLQLLFCKEIWFQTMLTIRLIKTVPLTILRQWLYHGGVDHALMFMATLYNFCYRFNKYICKSSFEFFSCGFLVCLFEWVTVSEHNIKVEQGEWHVVLMFWCFFHPLCLLLHNSQECCCDSPSEYQRNIIYLTLNYSVSFDLWPNSGNNVRLSSAKLCFHISLNTKFGQPKDMSIQFTASPLKRNAI